MPDEHLVEGRGFVDLFNTSFYGNSLKQWATALAALCVSYLLFRFLIRSVIHRLLAYAEKTKIEWDDIILDLLRNRTRNILLLMFSLYIGSLFLTLPDRAEEAIRAVATVALFLQAAIWSNGLIIQLIKRIEKGPESESTYTAISFIARVILWSLIILLILHNLGVNVTALVASLGVGGIAVALAVQNILSDLFASMTIVLDKPFIIGDFIIVGDLMGTVEHIGLKTTRIRSLSGEQIVFTNNDLLSSRIRNFKRMWERRIVFSVGVTYETPSEKVEEIPRILKEIIDRHEQARFDRAHFSKYGDSALIFEMVYFVKDPDYNIYMDLQQSINIEIFRRFKEEGIEFAYPTQTLYISKSGDSGEEGQ